MTAADHTPEQIASAYATLDLTLAHPDHFDMDQWAVNPYGQPDRALKLDDLSTGCGTTACFAGWHLARLGYAVDSYAKVYDKTGRKVGVADSMAGDDLGMSGDAQHEIFLETLTADLPAAIAWEFGPRPA